MKIKGGRKKQILNLEIISEFFSKAFLMFAFLLFLFSFATKLAFGYVEPGTTMDPGCHPNDVGCDINPILSVDYGGTGLSSIGAEGHVLKVSNGSLIWTDVSPGASIVDSDADTQIQIEKSSDDDTIRFDLGGSTPIEDALTINQADGLSWNANNNDLDFRLAGSSSDLFFLDASADSIGIGTTSPSALLSVGSGSAFQVNSSGAIAAATGITSSGTITFSGLTTDGIVTSTGGTLGSTATIGSGYITADSLNFSELSDSLVVDATTTFDLDTNSADLNFDSNTLFIDSSENKVGIGTSTPSHALDVEGSIRATDSIVYSDNSTQPYAATPNGFTWQITSAAHKQNFSVSTQETATQDLFFSTDGTKMYVMGTSGDDVNQYNLSTPWDVSTASYSQLFSISGQHTTPNGLTFSPDGTRMYVSGVDTNTVSQYSLSTAWDISTTSFVRSYSVAAYDNIPSGVFFKPDGTKMYTIGDTDDTIDEFTLTDPWNISTASRTSGFVVASQDVSPASVFFKSDGTRMYLMGAANDSVFEYILTTPWATSTAKYLRSFSVTSQETSPRGVYINPEATKMYVVGANSNQVSEYNLGIAIEGQFLAGSSSDFRVDSSGAIAAATGITSSGTITLSGLSDGVVLASSGVLSASTIGASFITANSLDFSEFVDAMTVDATTTFDLDTNSADLNFDSNTLFIDSSANRVGIGTNAPNASLDITGGFVTSQGIGVGGNGHDIGASIRLYERGGGAGTQAGTFSQIAYVDDSVNIPHFGVFTGGFGSARLAVDDSGRVGIGDITPDAQFDVADSSTDTTAATTEGLEFTVSDTGVVTTGMDTLTGLDFNIIRTGATGGTINTIGLDLDVTGDTGGTSTLTGLDVNVSGADTNYAALFQGGNVGIGTTSPNSTLVVGFGQLETPLGSAGAPSRTFTGDLDTGIYSSGADALSIATDGSERMRIYDNGNMALDDFTNLPGAAGNSAYKVMHFASPTSGGSTMLSMASQGQHTTFFGNLGGQGFVVGSEGTSRDIMFKTGLNYADSNTLNTGTTRMTIDGGGNVGIGTTAPSTALQVGEVSDEKDATIHGDIFIGKVSNDDKFNISNVGSADTSLRYLQIVNNDNIGSFSGIALTRTSVGIGTTAPDSLLHLSGAGDQVLRIEATDDNQATLNFNSNGVQKALVGYNEIGDYLSITHSESGTSKTDTALVVKEGNVGIGTSAPSKPLDVAGATQVGSLTTVSDTLVDADGSTTTGTGAANVISDGNTLTVVESADNLCADSLTAPTIIFTLTGETTPCNTTDGTTTNLLGTAAATTQYIEVSSTWVFQDTISADGSYTDGEDLYIDTVANLKYDSGNVTLSGNLYQSVYGSDADLVLYLPYTESGTDTTQYDRSPYGNDGTGSNGVVTSSTNGKYGSGASFDGTDDVITLPATTLTSISSTADMTAEAWVYPTAYGSDSWHLVDVFLYGRASGQDLVFGIGAGGSLHGGWWENGFAVAADGTLPLNTWTHVAMTYSDSDNITKLYANGVEVASVAETRTISHNYIGLTIGDGNSGYGEAFTGSIAESRIYKRALSQDEIRTHYLRGADNSSVAKSDSFKVVDTNNDVNFLVNSSGNVGIGDTSPSAALTVGDGDLFQVDSSGNVTLNADSTAITLGAGSDFNITHNGTNTVATSATGNLVIDNTNTTGATQVQLGTDTAATDFQVLNNTGTTLFEVNGGGRVEAGSISLDGNTIADTGNVSSIILDDDQTEALNMLSLAATSHLNLMFDSNNNSSGDFRILEGSSDTDTANELFRIKEDGKVGIGDNSPSALLTVGDGDLFQVNSSGAIAAATGMTSSGTITLSGLTTDGVVTATGGVLGTTALNSLDAGTLDSLDSTQFLRSDTSDSFTSGTLTFNDSTTLALGTAGDFTMEHDGSETTTLTANSRYFSIDNTITNGITKIWLGSNTSSSVFEVVTDNNSLLFGANGAGNTFVETGTLDNTTSFQVWDHDGYGLFEVFGDGNVAIYGDNKTSNFDPTAALHLGAGKADNPALKFTDGTLTSALEDGSLEYESNTGGLYFTGGGYREKLNDRMASTLATEAVSTWTSRSAPAVKEWQDVTWSPELGLFAAVSSDGSVMTSSDGITWTAQTAAETNNWKSIEWSPKLGLFAAVSSNGTNRVMTSPDGVTWTPRSAAATKLWIDLTWSPELGLFVAVAQDSTNNVMTSSDGTTWTSHAGKTGQWDSVTWSPEQGIFVAVGVFNNLVMTSPDGTTWTTRSPAQGNTWRAVAWSPELGMFAAVSDNGTNRVMTSPDGITWTTQNAASNIGWHAITWAPELGLFIAAADNGTNRVMTSPDGTTWTGHSVEDSGWFDITWSPELGIAVGVAINGTNRITTSKVPNSYSRSQELFTGRMGIGTTSPDANLDVVYISTDATASTTEGLEFTITDTGVVTTGTDALTGQQLNVTRTSATGGTINTIGLDINVTGDTGGTSKLIGLDVNVSGADTNYAALFQGGNVGIGDATPQHILEIQRSGGHSYLTIDTDNISGYDSGIRFRQNDTDQWVLFSDHGDGNFYLNEDTSGSRLTVEAGGNVGIGTISPSSLLEISAGTDGDAVLTLSADTDNSNDADNPSILFQQDGGTLTGFIGLEGIAGTRSTGTLNNALMVGSEDATPVQLITNDAARITITHAGNVGIGITSPSADLEVAGGAATDAIVWDNGAGALRHHYDALTWGRQTFNMFLDTENDSTNASFQLFNNVSSSTSNIATISLNLDGNDSWINSGNVGIGTTAPGAKMHVHQDSDTLGLAVSSNASTSYGLNVVTDSLTTGGNAVFHDMSTDTSSRALVSISNSNAAATGAVPLFIEQNSTGTALSMATATTASNAINVTANSLTTGSAASFSSDSSNTGIRNIVQIINDNTSATGATSLYVKNDSTGLALDVVGDARVTNTLTVDGALVTAAGLSLADGSTQLYGSTPSDRDWHLSTAASKQSKNTAAQNTGQEGLFFKPDGLAMYTVGIVSAEVNQYTLSTPWDVSTASATSVKITSTENSNPSGISFKPDGSKMYVAGMSGDEVNEYTLSTPWDVTTASASQVADFSSQVSLLSDVSFREDGTKMYLTDETGGGTNIEEYTLSVAWDISTASHVQGRDAAKVTGVTFKRDGRRMYVLDNTNDRIVEYRLTTPWDVSTAVATGTVRSTNTVRPESIYINPDGTKLYVLESDDIIYEYDLGMVIAGGNVGIGTTSPASELVISNNDTNVGLHVVNTNSTDSSSPAEIYFDRTAISGGTQKAAVGMDDTSRDFFIWVNGSDRLTIDEGGIVTMENITFNNPNNFAGGSTDYNDGFIELYRTGNDGAYIDFKNATEDHDFRIQARNDNNALAITGGNVGIDVTDPGSPLEVQADGNGPQDGITVRGNQSTTVKGTLFGGSGGVYIGHTENNFTNTTTAGFDLGASNWVFSSDERLKENVGEIEDALDKINSIRGIKFNWKDDNLNIDGVDRSGVIAQEIQNVMPELVSEGPDGYLAVGYAGFTSYLIEAVKELDDQIEEQMLRVDNLNGQLEIEDEGDGEGTSELLLAFDYDLDQLKNEVLAFTTILQQNTVSMAEMEDLNDLTSLQLEQLETRMEILEMENENENAFSKQIMSEEEIESLLTGNEWEEYLSLSELEKLNYELWQVAGRIVFAAKVRFDGAVEFASRVILRGSITVNTDTAGMITIPAGETKVKATFNVPFEEKPNVNLTPAQRVKVNYSLEDVDRESFVISIEESQDDDLVFNWTALIIEGDPIEVEVIRSVDDDSSEEGEEESDDPESETN